MFTPDWDDLDAFVALDDFAVQATFTVSGVVRLPIGAIFDDPSMIATLAEYEKQESRPKLTAPERDLVGVKRRDTVVIKGETFGVLTSPMGDGTGMAVIELARE